MIYEIILSDILYPKGLNADRNGGEQFNMMIKEIMEGKHIIFNRNKSRLLFSSAEMFKKPLWQTVWTQIRLLL